VNAIGKDGLIPLVDVPFIPPRTEITSAKRSTEKETQWGGGEESDPKQPEGMDVYQSKGFWQEKQPVSRLHMGSLGVIQKTNRGIGIPKACSEGKKDLNREEKRKDSEQAYGIFKRAGVWDPTSLEDCFRA